MKKQYLNLQVTILTIVLSALSYLIVIAGATNEPYLQFHKWDLFIQVGAASIIIVSWCQLFFIIISYTLFKKELSLWWIFNTIWIIIVIYYLCNGINEYINDVQKIS